MVMYFVPLTLTPSEMTFFGSDLSLKDLAMAALSSADSYTQSAPIRYLCAARASYLRHSKRLARIHRTTYREVGGCSPGSCALDVADKGLVDVAGADEAR
jgi:UDP-N-acetylglucosamine enolpyruvyl transferase